MWFACLPWLSVLIVSMVGIILVARGLRGRRVRQAPHCRKCGYNLTGLPSERCPECGGLIAIVGVVVVRRQRRLGLLYGGVLLLLPLLVVPLLLGKRALRYLDGYRYRPTAWVLQDARSSDSRQIRNAYVELNRRLFAGEMKPTQVQEFSRLAVDDCLRASSQQDYAQSTIAAGVRLLVQRRQLTPEQTSRLFEGLLVATMKDEYDSEVSSLLGSLVETRQLTPDQERRLFEQLLEVTMEAAPTALRSQGIPVVLRVRSTSPFPDHVFADQPIIQIARDPKKADLPPFPSGKLPELWAPAPAHGVLRESLTERPCSLSMHMPWSSRQTLQETLAVVVRDAGRCELNFVVSVDFYYSRVGVPNRYLWRSTRSFALKSEVTADPLPRTPLLSVWGPVHEPLIRSCMDIRVLRVPTTRAADHGHAQLDVEIEVRNPPLPLGFDVAVDIEGRIYRAGSFSALPEDPATAWHGAVHAAGTIPDRVSLVLTPRTDLVQGRAYEVWWDTLCFKDVPVASAPTPHTRPAPARRGHGGVEPGTDSSLPDPG
jgi:hypothetical protein